MNTMKERTVGAICLGLCFNSSGNYAFMKLSNSRKIIKKKFNTIPMLLEAIDAIAQTAKKQKGP